MLTFFSVSDEETQARLVQQDLWSGPRPQRALTGCEQQAAPLRSREHQSVLSASPGLLFLLIYEWVVGRGWGWGGTTSRTEVTRIQKC